jgi:uncharacterized protein
MTMKKPSESEDEFFARQDAEKRRKMALEKARELKEEELAQLKALHFMHCPKCGMPLETINFHDLQIERCYHCGGSFLDEGELERLAGKEPGFIQKVVAVFKGK